jgi:hypothetical protein
MTLDNAGNLGVGTTSPGTKLHVLTDGTLDPLRLQSTQSGFERSWTLGPNVGFNGVFAIRDSTAGANRLNIDSSGNLGVGTASPSEKLHVYGTAASGSTQGPRINLQYSGTSGAAESLINFLDFRGVVNAAIGNNLQDDGVGTAAAHMVFKAAVSGTLHERMRLDTSGQLQFPYTAHGTAQISNVYSLNVASGGTVDFANFSGMIIVNNWNQGSVAVWIVGGGTYTLIAGIASYYGGITYTGAYRWTSNSPSTHTYTFTAIRTRPNA